MRFMREDIIFSIPDRKESVGAEAPINLGRLHQFCRCTPRNCILTALCMDVC